MIDAKRKASGSNGDAASYYASQVGASSGPVGGSLVKRQRQDEGDDGAGALVAISSDRQGKDKGLMRSVKRTSSLQAPIVSLNGAHGAEILDVAFSPDGAYIAAASADRTISIWTTYGDNTNIGILTGHSKAVTSLTWSKVAPAHTPVLFSGSADGTLIVWEVLSGTKVRRLRGHKGIVNCVASTRSFPQLLVSGADDGSVLIWFWQEESRPREAIQVGYPVTAVEFSEDGSQVYVAGLDNDVHIYDLTQKSILYTLRGHTDTVLSISLSPQGTHLASSSSDGSIRIWDVRPFAPEPLPGQKGNARLQKTLQGLSIGFEQALVRCRWNKSGSRLAAGGGDRTATLPGHRGTCTAVDFHPKEPIIVSASFDQQLLLGEIEP
ncbi:U5 snRNP-specific protein-like factor and related proteins [Ceraceosorus bombacis]|uniref:U5 snRNP-specific protein-like factor and related proteins n=1 Tax=Ceraceosorus bombacis TaxID=401625 RepID=A0A0P1B9J9_9BASI|nr:U5 snRNP-specific protein-like factor and related proteins [Ceraceosorus bombacis]